MTNKSYALLTIAFAVACSTALKAATPIAGRVHDAAGQPLANVAVTADIKTSASTAATGEFSLQVPASSGKVDLLFEAPGYYSLTVSYEIKNPPAPLDVILTPRSAVREEVKVVASRLDISMASNPAATSTVAVDMLDTMPRAIAIDEPLRAVPGVKVDNQADGERVHLSIRGQGILSEHGIRGIQLLYDGIPLNDPSGFSPDVYDVDWGGVQEVNVVRGPVAFLYGGGSGGGVIDIHSAGAEMGPLHGSEWTEGGSNGFYKTRGEIAGSGSGIAYLFSGSRTAGDGYRQHTAFDGTNVYGRLGIQPSRSLKVSPYFLGTDFFNQNAEGLNLDWGYPSDEWWTSANPDSLTYNEFIQTHRLTAGFNGMWTAAENQRLSFNFYTRRTGYKEAVPSSVEHRDITAPGGSLQYDADSGSGSVRNHFGAGVDLDWQLTTDFRHPNLGNAVETQERLANATINQHRAGGYVTDRVTVGSKWTILGGLRFDNIGNELTDLLRANGLNLSGSQNFQRATGRLGVTWSAAKTVGLYASWGQGFMPPATEELYANPASLGGFNKSLVPATSTGEEVGARGSAGSHLFWDADVFRLDTKNDFERYRIASRPLETFYGNAGETRRYGLESSLRWLPAPHLTVTGAYTYSHFVYTHYTSLTYPGYLIHNSLPNCPRQQVFADASYEFAGSWTVGAGTRAFSRGFVDPTNRSYVKGYGLLDARLSKGWRHGRAFGTLFVNATNLAAKRYIAFSEPDPDGNSYQPGPSREIFGGIQIKF